MQSLRALGSILTDAARTFGRFIIDAARVIAAHWPQLVVLFLLGWIGRMSFLWITTEVSDWSPTLAVLILPFAPLSTLLSFVLMLRAMAPSLPAFAGIFEGAGPRQRVADDLTVAGQVMIPFLAVYASAGLLKQDTTVFLLDSTADESMNTAIQNIDWGRADYAPGVTIIAFIVIGLAGRKVISLKGLADRHIAWAGVAAYLEVLWIITLAQALSSELASVTSWITSRRIIATIIDWWEGFTTAIREWNAVFGGIMDAINSLLGNLGAVVIVPVAWLAIGAAVYGHKLNSVDLAMPSHEEYTKRIERVPSPVRRAARHVAEPVVSPIQSTLGAIRKIAVAGVLPMIMFCVVFLVAGAVQSLAALAMRALFGPGEALRQFALEPYTTMVERGAYFVIALALLAAAVNAIVLAQKALAERPADDVPAGA